MSMNLDVGVDVVGAGEEEEEAAGINKMAGNAEIPAKNQVGGFFRLFVMC